MITAEKYKVDCFDSSGDRCATHLFSDEQIAEHFACGVLGMISSSTSLTINRTEMFTNVAGEWKSDGEFEQ